MNLRAVVVLSVLTGCGIAPKDVVQPVYDTADDNDFAPGAWLWQEVDELSDIVLHEGATHFLVANVTRKTIEKVEVFDYDLVDEATVTGVPERIVSHEPSGQAAVLFGEDGVKKIDIVDLETFEVRTMEVQTDEGFHACWDGEWQNQTTLYLLCDDATGFGKAVVIEVDAAGLKVNAFWKNNEIIFKKRIRLVEGDVYIGEWRYDFPANASDPLEVAAEYDSTPQISHRLQLSDDGQHAMFNVSGGHNLFEFDRTTGEPANHYVADDGDVFGSKDYTYNHAQNRVLALNIDFDVHFIQIFDRSNQKEVANLEVAAPEEFETVFYEREFFFLTPDDQFAYTYKFNDAVSANGILSKTQLIETGGDGEEGPTE